MGTQVDYLVIGAGPAGLQLGYYLEQNGRDYLILERSEVPGSFFQTYPRHRKLISINKVHTGTELAEANLRWDWNSLLSDGQELRFGEYTKEYFPHPDTLLEYLAEYARTFNIRVRYNTQVASVSRSNGLFLVKDSDGNEFQSRRLIVATGMPKELIPDIPGAELCDTYGGHSIDTAEYVDKRVLVVGKGNSAFETADHLIPVASAIHVCSPEPVKMAWQTHFVGNLRAVNNNFLDTYQLKSQNTVIDGNITGITKDDDGYEVEIAYSHAKGQTTRRRYDRVIFCTGFRFDRSIFDESCMPETIINGKLPAQTVEWESTNVPDLYFAGTLMQACDYRKTMSGFIHGFRHNIRTLSWILEKKYHGEELPSLEMPVSSEALLDRIVERVNHGAGIFLQPGFLADVAVVSEPEGVTRYYEDLRRDYIANSEIANSERYYTVSLEYGRFEGDPFSVERDPDPHKGMEAAYLHPVIREYRYGEMVSLHHIQDDLESQWYLEEYVAPARQYLQRSFSTVEEPAVA